jgi:hypothetical protein
MPAKFCLGELVKSQLKEIVDQYALETVEIDAHEVVLKARTYALDIIAGREGIAIVYFDRDALPFCGRNLFSYLLKARSDLLPATNTKAELSSYTEFIKDELDSLSLYLRTAAHDILSGSKVWLSGNRSPVIQARPSIAAVLRQLGMSLPIKPPQPAQNTHTANSPQSAAPPP